MNIQYHFLVLVLSVVLERSDLGNYTTLGSHSRTGGAFLCCSSHFASSLADSRGAPE